MVSSILRIARSIEPFLVEKTRSLDNHSLIGHLTGVDSGIRTSSSGPESASSHHPDNHAVILTLNRWMESIVPCTTPFSQTRLMRGAMLLRRIRTNSNVHSCDISQYSPQTTNAAGRISINICASRHPYEISCAITIVSTIYVAMPNTLLYNTEETIGPVHT